MSPNEKEICNLLEKVNENGLNCRSSLEAQISLVMLIQEQGFLNMAYSFCTSCLLRSELLLVRHDPLAIVIVAVMASLLFSLGDYKNAEVLLDDYVHRRHESSLALENEGLTLIEETLLSELMEEKDSTLGETSFVKLMKVKLHEPWYKHPFRMFRLWRFRGNSKSTEK